MRKSLLDEELQGARLKMICRCEIEINGERLYADLLEIRDGRATILIDGYEASDSIDANKIKDTWT